MIEHLVGEKVEDIDQMSDLAKRLYYRGLTLPQNLIVMGTVNMDETTFSFSRKVLDRAMSIEMNEVNYDAFLAGTTEDDIPVLTDINNLLVDRPIKALEVKNDIDGERIKEYLKSINAILEGTPFKLGYRAANEAILYVAASKAFGKDNVAEALDDFTLMKILSRIEGDSAKLKTANGECILESLSDFFNSEEGILSELKSSTALAKLRSMKLILERDHFVSFWN
jgi:5-methylcytosine-specific restriction endonuclease McrBC GTP-binding regulatory subunit McrB